MPPEDQDPTEDLKLVNAVRRGDPAAMGQLLTRHQSRMFGLCYHILRHRELAADACQDAMVKLIQGLDGYDGRAQFTTWLTRIVINVCLSKLRSEKIRRSTSLDSESGAGGEGEAAPLSRRIGQTREPSAASRVEEHETRSDLWGALAALDPDQRTIVLLRDQRGLDYEEIGEVLGVAVGTVKSRLFRARAALRAELDRRSESRGEGGTKGGADGGGGNGSEQYTP